MKALLKTRLALFILLFGLMISCKKNETAPADNYGNETDSTEMMIDTVGPNSDTTNVTNPGTTGATGESSTGSGTAGSVQKGSAAVQDSAKNSNGK
jgi:hypothetical protein